MCRYIFLLTECFQIAFDLKFRNQGGVIICFDFPGYLVKETQNALEEGLSMPVFVDVVGES